MGVKWGLPLDPSAGGRFLPPMARILVVDDDAPIRRVLRALFERNGHDVIEAATATEALESLALPVEARPEAVVCDVLMPGMSGLEFYEQLAVLAPDLRDRVVFLTGANHDPAVHQPIEQLGVPLLGKLDDLQLLVDAIRLALLRAKRG
jgi:CheY-like chemotaxis protein